MLETLFLNLCTLIACAFTLSFTYRAWPIESRGPWYALRLTGLAATSVLLMHFPATLAPGVIADLRAVPVVFALLHGGPLAGVAVAIPSVLYRLSLGGVGAHIMVISTLSMLVVGTLVRVLDPLPTIQASWTRRGVRSVLTLLPNGIGLLLLPGGQALFAQAYLPVLLLSVTGYLVTTMVVGSRLTTLRLLSAMEGQALLDALTGIPNRRQFDRDVAQLRPEDAVLMVDVDHFKALNDTYGHAVGDDALREIAQRLGEELRRGDRAYRYGGEEFAVILRAVGRPHLPVVAERLRAAVARDPLRCSRTHATVSVGAAVATGDAPSQVVAHADHALYQAKASGRDCVVISTGSGSTPCVTLAKPPPVPERGDHPN